MRQFVAISSKKSVVFALIIEENNILFENPTFSVAKNLDCLPNDTSNSHNLFFVAIFQKQRASVILR